MPTRVPSLLDPPVAFAQRGARAHAPESTLESFRLACKLGATGLQVEAWATAEGDIVLHPESSLRLGLRRRPIAALGRADLPTSVPGLAELYDACGTELEVAVTASLADAPAVVETARRASRDAVGRLWLRTAANDTAAWRDVDAEVKLVHVTRLRDLRRLGPERHAASLRDAGVDAVELPADDWSAGLTTLFHRFGRLAVGAGAQHRRQLDALVVMGIDALVSDHVDRMADALRDHA